MRDQIPAKLNDYERARFSEDADVFNDYFLVADNDSLTSFKARAVADFIRRCAKDLIDAEVIGLCYRVEARAQHILQLETRATNPGRRKRPRPIGMKKSTSVQLTSASS